jgi:type I restriction-modification system DNA methylase subunit
MAFDSATRNKLARMIAQARQLLVEEFTQQLQELYGIQPDGSITDLEKLAHLDAEQSGTAKLLRERIDHLVSAMETEEQPEVAAIDRTIREQAFTILNRFAALRMCEERGFVEECVRGGIQSKGFKVYETIAGAALGDTYEKYKTFLFCLFDEIAFDLGVLFDRLSPQGLLFPREKALLELFANINNNDLENIWAEDETIGWIYQYFNQSEERRAMRAASRAPRNSRELAVRNQFFTPRYVVEFLTDNTLGRTWYEMRRGDTTLKEDCGYLVRRPNEVFLSQSEKAPPAEENEINLSQEELLKKPVYIENRLKKDPRDLRVLDPACGSGHFLLYAFDLLESIYEEAWKDPESPKAEASGRTLREDYATLDDLRLAAPKLIVEHNLYGIDIDPRAVQIAALALWLRAQKSWKNIGLKADGRKRIARSNIVTAEPMPGEEEMRREFVEGLKPRVLGQLVEVVFDKMNIAGEAGSLLKIEEEIKEAVAEAKKQWLESSKPEQQSLFPNKADPRPKQQELRFDLKGVTEEQFWEHAEGRILAALQEYTARADNGRAVRRRLYADDASRGFAFIELCRKRYDVVLMNPPFGEATSGIEPYLGEMYPRTKKNLYCSFVERSFDYCLEGFVGLISARTFVMYRDFEKYRRELLLGGMTAITSFADLGWEVLDGAQVETAALALKRSKTDLSKRETAIGPFFRLLALQPDAKGEELLRMCKLPSGTGDVYFVGRDQLGALPGAPLAYWASRRLVEIFSKSSTFEPSLAYCGRGAAAHVFFFRLAWEVPLESSTLDRWTRLAHGGEYSPFFRENSVVIDWEDNGKKVKQYIVQKYPYLKGNYGWAIQDEDKYGLVGVTSGKRNERFNAQLMPAGHIFTNEGQGFIPHTVSDVWFSLGYLNSSLVSYFLTLTSGLQKTWVYIRPVPVVEIDSETRRLVETIAEENFETKRKWTVGAEEGAFFVCPWLCKSILHKSLRHHLELNNKRKELSTSIIEAVNLEQSDRVEVEGDFQRHPDDLAFAAWRGFGDTDKEKDSTLRLVSYLVGCIFGRWDVRIAMDQSLAPKLPDAFDSLPICPPGMLVGPDGLPAGPSLIVSQEWLLARPDANVLPPEGSVKNPTIKDTDYPLRISWDGVLVDDSSFNGGQQHREDVAGRVREVLDLMWKDKADEIEQEVCEISGFSDLRDYFRKPSGFFQDHLKRYSKSRRKAPIYWPISTSSGSYTLWIYYHRLTDQTLYACINDYVNPKLDDVAKDIGRLQEQDAKQTTAQNRQKLEQLMDLERELKDFRDELLRVATLPYKPNLNDGLMITGSPLWRLFRHTRWRRDLETCWQKLEAGEYDWTHLAYAIWPDRVKAKCKKDLFIAIAHGLEGLYEGEVSKTEKRRKKAKA